MAAIPLVITLALVVYCLVGTNFTTFVVPEGSLEDNLKDKDLLTVFPKAPQSLVILAEDKKVTQVNFGRWKDAIAVPEMPPRIHRVQEIFQRKEWLWASISDSSRYLLGTVVGNFHYLGFSFVYLFDATKPDELLHWETRSPFGIETSVSSADPTINGFVLYQSMFSRLLNTSTVAMFGDGTKLDILVSASVGRYRKGLQGSASENLPLRVKASVDVGSDELFSAAYPIGPNRPIYTHKAGGLQIVKRDDVIVQVGDEAIRISSPLCQFDFSRGLFPRITRWYWVSLSFTSKDHKDRIGLQLSDGIYRDLSTTKSFENVVWLNGKLHTLDQALQWNGKWSLKEKREVVRDATNPALLELHFTPLHDVHGQAHVMSILDADLHHIIGLYSGRVTIAGKEIVFDSVPGIFEDHYAKW